MGKVPIPPSMPYKLYSPLLPAHCRSALLHPLPIYSGHSIEQFDEAYKVVEVSLFFKGMDLIHAGGDDRRGQPLTCKHVGVTTAAGDGILQGPAGQLRSILYP